MRSILIIAAFISLTSCAHLRINSNASPFIQGQISSSGVAIYSMNEVLRYDAEYLANVQSSYCQEIDDAEARREQRTRTPYSPQGHLLRQLQVETQLAGGNGLVAHQCHNTYTNRCSPNVQCSGSAYWVEQGK
ncbi:hypothetical protein E2K93_11370 [Thalassotalea sp. HSM 43]|uniref:hypothetical protein n=1 Tax=Thalassotalea sp. HSM 43 TaxID=2552945 RepID=UPI00107FD890|nr:hypothetical protein [Thalassotalea sp. HSM 43]QBY04945.1 hypothetical protein E2K93_11370 [Thalassotalea sp. HSM 43]